MAPVFSPDIIARVKDETDIVEIVRQHVQLKPAGAVYKGLCPFHKEKTPSFIVTPSRQRYHCFGCGTGGDVISFLMEAEGLSFPEAVELLARPLDIDLSDWLKEDESEGERRAFHRANEAAMTLWRDALWDDRLGRTALQYLQDRGFGERVLREYDVGWAPGGSGWLAEGLAKAGVTADLAQRADLLRPSDRGGEPFAYFRSRIIFPIKIISRQVAGFGGRVIDQGEPKYLNSADSAYFNKGKLLYGFEASRMAIAREKKAILVEGYLDLLALAQVGFANVVATCGTAFTPDQARLIRRGAPEVLLLFDGDKAGLKAAVRSADVALRAGLEPRIVTLPRGQDPADVAIAGGAEPVQELIRSGQGYVPFMKALAEQGGHDRVRSERALRKILDTVAGIEDPLRREYLLQEAAEGFGMAADVVRRSLPAPPPGGRGPASATPAAPEQPPAPEAPPEPEGEGEQRSRTRVLRFGVNRDAVAAELLAHVLRDETGSAARALQSRADQVAWPHGQAAALAAELALWSTEGRGQQPREFVTSRWNLQGDARYRGYVSRLINREDIPAQTDFTKVVEDCLGRLRRDADAAGN